MMIVFAKGKRQEFYHYFFGKGRDRNEQWETSSFGGKFRNSRWVVFVLSPCPLCVFGVPPSSRGGEREGEICGAAAAAAEPDAEGKGLVFYSCTHTPLSYSPSLRLFTLYP